MLSNQEDASARRSRLRVEGMLPTYDYICTKCRHGFEAVQPFSAEPVAACPKCSGKSERQFSVPVVVYKGSGFYTTDHGRSSANRSTAKKEESGGSGDSGSTANPASESKEAAKTPAATAAAPAKGD